MVIFRKEENLYKIIRYTCIAFVLVILAGCMSSMPASANTLPEAHNWRDDFPMVNNDNVLGIAGQFTIFSETIDTSQNNNINGNFATISLKSSDNPTNGSNGLSYMQNFSSVPGNYTRFGGDTVVLGNKINYQDNFKDGKGGINGTQLIQAPTKGFRQETSDQNYIDMNSEMVRLNNNSKAIAEYSKNNVPIVTNWYGAVTIDTSQIEANENVKYFVLKAADIPNNASRVTITGLSSNQKAIITIDTSDVTSINYAHLSFYNGTEKQDLLFNFYNIEKGTNYAGSINWTTQQSSGTKHVILAPKATVDLASSSFQGHIVAKQFINQYMGVQSGNYEDMVLPSNTKPQNIAKLISVPDIDFGTHILQQEDTLTGNWTGDFKVSATEGQNLKIDVAVQQPFNTGSITWELIHNQHNNGELQTSKQELSGSSAEISYWIWQKDGTGNLLTDWHWNQDHRINDFYTIKINNLKSVTNAGNYTAKLLWTLKDTP